MALSQEQKDKMTLLLQNTLARTRCEVKSQETNGDTCEIQLQSSNYGKTLSIEDEVADAVRNMEMAGNIRDIFKQLGIKGANISPHSVTGAIEIIFAERFVNNNLNNPDLSKYTQETNTNTNTNTAPNEKPKMQPLQGTAIPQVPLAPPKQQTDLKAMTEAIRKEGQENEQAKTPDQWKEQLIDKLLTYRQGREDLQDDYKTRFSKAFGGHSRQEKLAAVDALIASLNGSDPSLLEKNKEIYKNVLREGSLGKEIRDFVQKNKPEGVTTVSALIDNVAKVQETQKAIPG